MARVSPQQAGGKNRVAFLDTIAVSEIGTALLAVSDDGYNVLVGSTPSKPLLFRSYATHPNILNRNIRFPSTAAGRYQLLNRWYAPYARLLGLKDFSPLAQDLIALQQIKERRAFPLIDAGRFEEAVFACSNIWASFPGNNYGQPQHTMNSLKAAFIVAGGVCR